MSSSQFELTDPPRDAISALKFAPNDANKLLVSSWDRNVYLYDTHDGESGRLTRTFEHPAPVLDVCFGQDDNEAFTAGLDWNVRRINLETGELEFLSSHTAGVKSVAYSSTTKLLISGSWDCTLHVHSLSDDRSAHTTCTVPLPSKPFSISMTPTKVVVAMANRAVYIYDLKSLALLCSHANSTDNTQNIVEIEPLQRRESAMKFMTRAIACMPNDSGWAASTIEGRIAVEWFDPSETSQARKYAFKCHRQTVDGVDVVYPVNALAFHPIHGTFVSGGGDGVVAVWDGVAKRRIRQYQRFPTSVAALAFSANGKYLAVAVSPGFEDGKEDPEGVVKVFIRELGESETKGKASK
ncbi:cell cycle arrest protein BUB3 [Trichodelitschia bisporula]|uniref:Cell cycle arrest protein BUB3 n=1 Tax=Trichodelitschia bisporula TaxID=703511 RepID=A0A6G1HLD9_9PEZI|nr:cell cycle arrest protein BUB3 [Trichodelitschia bisporula]